MERVALVAGGVRGLGLAAARGFLERGERVHVTWRSSGARAAELEAEFPGRVHQLDLEDRPAVDALVARILERDGRLDFAVSAVGAYRSGALAETDLDFMWRSNVMTAMNLAGAVHAALRESRGALVLFGCAGLAGLRARKECAAYAAAKSALLVLVRSMAVEEAPFEVRVNMVSPGLIPHDAAHKETLDARLQAHIPAGRPGTLEEIAAAVLHLTSDAARHTTGCDLPVAGGWML